MAIDDVDAIQKVCVEYGVWLHIDAAYAGTALLLPEYHWMAKGIEGADSFVFNPHKWMFTNFDCTIYLVKNASDLIQTFEILPEYLKTDSRGVVNDYRDWGVQLGRRFRALKLWFVFRSYGLSGLQERLRYHIKLMQKFSSWLTEHPKLEVMIGPVLNYVAFRYVPPDLKSTNQQLNELNEVLLGRINHSGKAYLSHTKHEGDYIIRVLLGQTYITDEDVVNLMSLLDSHVEDLEHR